MGKRGRDGATQINVHLSIYTHINPTQPYIHIHKWMCTCVASSRAAASSSALPDSCARSAFTSSPRALASPVGVTCVIGECINVRVGVWTDGRSSGTERPTAVDRKHRPPTTPHKFPRQTVHQPTLEPRALPGLRLPPALALLQLPAVGLLVRVCACVRVGGFGR